MSFRPALDEAYGTSKVAMKLPEKWEPMKGGLPLAALVGGLLLARGMSRSADAGVADAKLKHNVQRFDESNRNSQINSTLRGGAPLDPMGSLLYQNERADSGIPGDVNMFDKAAAAVGEEAGRVLAKAAGIGGAIGSALGAVNKAPNLLVGGAQKLLKPIVSKIPGPGLLGKAAIGAGVLGAGMLAAKGAKKAGEFGMAPPQEHALGGHSAALPSYVNQYGVPTMG